MSSIPDLTKELVSHFGDMIRTELKLARTEARSATLGAVPETLIFLDAVDTAQLAVDAEAREHAVPLFEELEAGMVDVLEPLGNHVHHGARGQAVELGSQLRKAQKCGGSTQPQVGRFRGGLVLQFNLEVGRGVEHVARAVSVFFIEIALRAGHELSVAAMHYTGRIAETDRALARAVASLLVATAEDTA